jgi:hypothetical protein
VQLALFLPLEMHVSPMYLFIWNLHSNSSLRSHCRGVRSAIGLRLKSEQWEMDPSGNGN